MNAYSHCFALLLIVFIGTRDVCAQSSFLDELRISTRTDQSGFASLQPELPLVSSPATVEGFCEESRSHQSELDDATVCAGFESDCESDPGCAPDFDCMPSSDTCDASLIRYRTTCFQGAQAAYGVIPEGNSDGLGIQTLDLFGTFAIPLGSMDHVVSFTPFFRQDALNASASLDVPDALYEAGVKSFWKKVVNERLTTMVLFTPSVRSDYHSSQDAFKLFGMGLLQWRLKPDKLSMTGGAIYTGRQDYPVLPTMGLYWTPSPVWKLDIQFPSPRIARRLLKDGDQSETWGYLSGVFGGNTWAVKRANGEDDQLTLRDLRLVFGVEHLLRENRGLFVETGLVLSRSMEYESTPGQIDFADAVLVRAGIQF